MKRGPKAKVEGEGWNHPVFRLLSFVLASFVLLGCSRGKIERVEWPVMSTVAAVQFRGGPVDRDVVEAVRAAFEKTG